MQPPPLRFDNYDHKIAGVHRRELWNTLVLRPATQPILRTFSSIRPCPIGVGGSYWPEGSGCFGPHYLGRPISTIEKLAEERSQFFISGVAHYRGPFSRSPEYLTEFCFAVIPIKENNAVRPVYQPCLYWNCAYDDCNRYPQLAGAHHANFGFEAGRCNK